MELLKISDSCDINENSEKKKVTTIGDATPSGTQKRAKCRISCTEQRSVKKHFCMIVPFAILSFMGVKFSWVYLDSSQNKSPILGRRVLGLPRLSGTLE